MTQMTQMSGVVVLSINNSNQVPLTLNQFPSLDVKNMICDKFPSSLCSPDVPPIVKSNESLRARFIIIINLGF